MTVTTFDLIGFSIVGALIITMTLGIVLTAFIPALDRWSKRYFIALFSLMFLCAVTHFRLPPLTLQPLVENAVKHGMNPSGDPLHIYVKTIQTNSGSEIIVENDGPDFVPANDNEPHIALNNIRQRLEMMCKGTLEITPREGGGTAVTVFIPNQSQ